MPAADIAPGGFPAPLPGETAEDYFPRAHFEDAGDGRFWCLDCGALIRDADWRWKHYQSVAHSHFKSF